MKNNKYPLILLALLAATGPALAQTSAPTTGVRRLPADGGKAVGAPPAAPTVQESGPPPAATQPVGAQPIVAAKPLTAAETAAFAAALKATDESRWADARAAVAGFRNTLLDRYVAWSILRAAPRTEASFADTWRFLREQPDWPDRQSVV